MAISRTTHTSDVSYTLPEGVDDLILTGTDNIEGTGNILDNQITGNVGDNILQGLEGNDTLLGMDGADVLLGGIGADNLDGGNGNDVLNGGTGGDTMIGGAGDDVYVVDDFADIVVEEVDNGTDTVQSTVSYTLGNNVENLVLLGTDSLSGSGNELDNIITGAQGGDFLSGYAGNDSIYGGAGNDYIDGGDGNNLLSGGEGDDYLYGSEGDDTLTGDQGNDNLVGGAGNNTYIYTNGHDFINNEEYPSPQEDNGVGDLLTIANFARSQAVFSQDIQIATTLVISFPSSETDSIRINNFFNVDATGKIETYSKDAIETLIFKDGTVLTAAQIVGIFNNTPPQIINDPLNAEVNEDGSITLDLLSNVSDVNGQSLTITKVDLDDPTQGSLGFLDSQEIVFTPAANFNGAVSLTYTVSDGVASVTGKTIIQVMPINDAPTALLPLDEQSVDEGQSFVFTIPTEAFTDIDGDNLAYSASLVDGSPLPSWLSFNDKTQTFSGIPSFSDAGTLQVKVVATDPDGLFTSQIFTLDINDVNQAPIAISDAPLLITNEDTDLAIDLSLRIADPDGDDFTIESASSTAGTVVINADKTLTYTPTADFYGIADLTYTVKDSQGATFTKTESITVNAVNDAPVAVSPSPITNQQGNEGAAFNYKIPVNAAFNDVDSDEGGIIYSVAGLPDWLSFDSRKFILSGTPTFNDAGKHIITVTATDDGGLSASTSFELTINNVNREPVVSINQIYIDEDSPIQDIDVVSSIYDPDTNDTISISDVSVDASQGVAILNADKTISFTPANDFNGTAIINFVVSDGTAFVNSSVEVVVQPVNDAPVLTSTPIDLNDPIEDTSYVLYANDLLQGYTDIDGDILSIIKLTVSNGTLVDNNDGSYVYTPNLDYFGNIQLNYYVSDGIAETPVTRTLNVINQNDAPTGSATAILKNGQEDVAYIVKASDLLQGFSEVDGEALSVINLSANQGTVIDNLDGTFTIQAPQNYNGAINLNYQVTDSTYTLSANQTFVLVPVNDAPNTQDIIGNLQINEGQSFLYALSANSFKDLDGDVLTYTATLENGDPLPNWLIFNQNTLGFSGTPSFSDAGVLQITVVASDGSLTAAQTFALQIQDVNRAPMALDVLGNFSTNEDQSLDNINVLSLVADPDGDPLTVTSAVITAGQGTISINANQTLNFNPTPNFNGSVTISYRVEDGRGGFTDRQDTIVVNPINDAPIAPSTPVVLANGTEDNTYTINLSDLLQGY
ncbi:MAG TPA: tandem-95 repeat protein, partial [Agitococcus sp.]|nr:tandem-95 repeat protein [Agitococcus sp.]